MILRLSSALICLLFAVSTVNAQCSSCAQGSAPMFSQGGSAPVYSSMGYAQPVNQGFVSSLRMRSNPCVSQGCGGYASQGCGGYANQGCGGCGSQMTYTSAPAMMVTAQSGCTDCAQTVVAPAMTYTSAAVSAQSGCGCGSATMAVGVPADSGCCSAPCASPCQNECVSNSTRTRRVGVFGSRRARCSY